MKLKDGMLLYHGSYVPVKEIDLNMCAKGKDFGRGFYLTASLEQAINFINTSLMKAKTIGDAPKEQNYGYVSCFKYHCKDKSIPYFEFEEANKEWLWFIALNRRRHLTESLKVKLQADRFFDITNSEIIVGKIANDTTNPVITTYLNGLYGDIKNDSSANIAISLLLPDRLKEQFCFLSERAVECLEFVEVKRYER
ncbi:MAG: DUF3990 domain-containing protein [Phascolarctobacterium sp.]|nr:DUF3990 domain-containing protein [Phascolarctobacterium sp.]